MAELIATRKLEWRRNSDGVYDPEFRLKKYGAMNLFLDAARRNALVDADVRRKAVGSTGNTIKIKVMKDKAGASVGTERSCTPVNNRTDSDLVLLEWTSITDGFTMVPNEYDTNDIGYQLHWEKNMASMIRRIAEKIDQLCIANLEAHKTAVLENDLGYAATAGVVNAKWDERMYLFNDLGVMLDAMNHSGYNRIVNSVAIESILGELGLHGTQNDVNFAKELLGKEFYTTNQLNETGKFGAMYAVAGNQVDILSRVSRAEYHGNKAANHEFGTITLPLMGGLTFGTHFIESVGDVSGITGYADQNCDVKHEYGFAIDLAFVNAYQTDNKKGIVKATIERGARGVQTVAPAAGSKWPNA